MKRYADTEDYRKNRLEWAVLKKFFPRFRPYMWSILLCLCLLTCSALLSLAGPLLVRHAIDVNFKEHDTSGLFRTSALYLLVLILTFGFSYFQRINMEIVGQKIIRGIRTDIFTHLTRMCQSFFDTHPVGQLLSRIESDTEALRSMFTNTVVMVLSDILMMVGMFIVMFSISFRLTLILFFMAPLVICVILYFNGKIVPIFIEVRRKTAEIYAFLEEYLRGVLIVQAFGQEENVTNRMNYVNKNRVVIEYPGHRLGNYFGHIIFFISTLTTVLILGFGGTWVMKDPRSLTIGTLVAFLGYIFRFFGPIFHLSDQLNVIQKAFGGARRINEIMETPLRGYGETQMLSTVQEKKGIEFKNVWFAYKDEEWVLKDISFFLPPGKRLAIVGPTGAGKTTLTSLLFRFYESQKGQILLDGVDISTLPLEILRKRLGLVLQDIILFPGTILDNLRMEEKSISSERVLKALDVINARDLVDKMPEGLNSKLSEHGDNLSMGEKQLLSFARAMVFDPEILVLDEATSSIDPLTERKLQNAISAILTGRTSIVIAHRLQTIIESDIILVLEDGIVKEQGTHNELLTVKGIYWNLYQIQAGVKECSS
ncbi:MAG TPA: ABC transporter ATP-binding protein [Candidatus Eremiobacteraeota bacterium]|nr:MAG: putative ABC transporter ATP-binding protein [bacterium ADurb.Bin363]HPZ08002.1 ABC transporter ATP-binding protein [Candidatus Eremiobacteraeota bacterium]